MSCGHRGTNIDIYLLPPLALIPRGVLPSLWGRERGIREHRRPRGRPIECTPIRGRTLVCYLGGMSVHACTQLYTHMYTTVYTRVHSFALSISPTEPSTIPFPGLSRGTARDMVRGTPSGQGAAPTRGEGRRVESVAYIATWCVGRGCRQCLVFFISLSRNTTDRIPR